MDVTVLLPYPYDIATRQLYRLEQWAPELDRRGIRLHMRHLFDSPELADGLLQFPPRLRSLAALTGRSMARLTGALRDRSDAVVVHREASRVGPPLIELVLGARLPMVLDLDDAIWMPPAGGRGGALGRILRMPGKTNWIMRMSSGVSAGNRYIAEHAARFCRNVEVVPTTVDTLGTYAPLKQVRRNVDELVVGWSGSRTTATYIEALLPTLARISREIPLRLLVMGAEVHHPELRIECRRWSPEVEVPTLLEMDVGLMPLVEDPWTRGKCGAKALMYMALGIPAVISPVGVNSEIVRHGENGLLAQSDEEWARALRELQSPERRALLGAAGRTTVRERYSAAAGAAALERLLRRVVRR